VRHGARSSLVYADISGELLDGWLLFAETAGLRTMNFSFNAILVAPW